MRTAKQLLGEKGEEMAAEYLKAQGYEVICKNIRHGKGELDLICMDNQDLVIVEVKTVRDTGFGPGEQRISKKKQREIIRTTYAYLDKHPVTPDKGVRFDVVIVNLMKHPAEVLHYKGAFWQILKLF